MKPQLFCLCVGLAFLVTLAGCGEPAPATGRVSGTAMVNGKPLTVGVIRFVDSKQGMGAAAPLGPGGQFSVPEPVRVGSYVAYWTMPTPRPVMPGDPPAPKAPADAPRRDCNEESSKARVEVKPGANTFNLDLQ